MANKKFKKLFVALPLPSVVIQEIVRLQTMVKNQFSVRVTTPLPEHMHITLAFIGLVDPDALSTIASLLKTVRISPFTVHLGPLSFFSAPQHGKILYVSLPCEALMHVGNTIQKLLHQHGIVPMPTAYVPHITIARLRHVQSPEKVLNFVAHTQVLPLTFEVRDFYLMESVMRSDKRVHQTLNRYTLI